MVNYDNAFSFTELYKATLECAKGVRWKPSVIDYLINIESRTARLVYDLATYKYKLSPYETFYIYEPKIRTIRSTKFRDRVVQRSLCNNGVYYELTKGFITDNCACIKGRGVTYAFKRMKKHMQWYYKHYGTTGWVLRMDIKKFFDSIPHVVVKDIINKKISDLRVRRMLTDIVDSFEDLREPHLQAFDPFGRRGLGLGSQISQLLALAVLDIIDHYVKDVLKIKCYIRYMDDIVIIHHDKEYLKAVMKDLDLRLSALGLTLNKKSCILPLKQGIWFLKRKHILTKTGKIITKISRSSIMREQRKIHKLKALLDLEEIILEDAIKQFTGWYAHVKTTCSKTVIYRMTKLFKATFGI